MQAKSVLYAAVGAPVVAARKVTDQVANLKSRFSEERASYTDVANKRIDEWATEGEKVVSGIRDGKVVEEISHKVDLDQAKEQVGKLRDQLEDMLATWRQSFRPEKAEEAESDQMTDKPAAKSTADKPAAKSTAGKPAAKSTAGKSATKASAAKATKSPSAAKTSTEKKTASKAKSSS